MILTITGVPCSGKTSIINYLKDKYGFKVVSVSKACREEAIKNGMDIVEYNRLLTEDKSGEFDRKLDAMTVKLGKQLANEKVIFDSRLAWHFIPNSFKVYIKVSPDVMLKRLQNSDREDNEKQAGSDDNSLLERYNLENKRFYNLYGVVHSDENNYDFVLDNSNLSIEESAEIVYNEYLKRLN